VRDLLNATNSDGSPNQELRRKGAELFVKNPKLLDAEDADDEMLPGCHQIIVFPRAKFADTETVVTFSESDLYRPEEAPSTAAAP
jgi:hypothetical protein